ncbi:uncharacterized protein I303_107495 [Kwoniella dejecticola CBS 10117]|uniref:BRCT domain-containing protein n=1 Tax=Kwoniella dejecticola CBS 10117 TaxID=1296121 RepID=A0A1A5ZZU1_9TREE|nr:uncharacterized protein I303_06900 [Kwoniella dejecticola CBS 10117]OBR83335.1 hypothetical protein I303_06900 [Kwoniella dejecticola CBS 10117]
MIVAIPPGRPSGKTPTHSRFFNDFTFYVCSFGGEGDWRSKYEIERIIRIIKRHGGSISRSPSSHEVIHIILPLNPGYPQDVVLQVDAFGPDLISLEHQQEWTDNDIIRHFARTAGGSSSPDKVAGYKGKKKVVLRGEWLDECERQDRVVGTFDEYAGWEIKGTYGPQFVNITPFGEPHIPFEMRKLRSTSDIRDALDLSSAHELSQSSPFNHLGSSLRPVTIDKLQRTGDPSDPTHHREEMMSTAGHAEVNGDSASTELQVTDAEEVKPILTEDSRPNTPELPAAHLEQSAPSMPAQNASSWASVVPSQAATPRSQVDQSDIASLVPSPTKQSRLSSVDTPSISSFSQSQTHLHSGPSGTAAEQEAVFASGILPLPLGFHVVGSSRERRSLGMLIMHTGGGFIVPKSEATIHVLPLPMEERVSDPAHLEIIEEVATKPTQAVVSEDWVYNCISNKHLLSLDEYRLHRTDPRLSD